MKLPAPGAVARALSAREFRATIGPLRAVRQKSTESFPSISIFAARARKLVKNSRPVKRGEFQSDFNFRLENSALCWSSDFWQKSCCKFDRAARRCHCITSLYDRWSSSATLLFSFLVKSIRNGGSVAEWISQNACTKKILAVARNPLSLPSVSAILDETKRK